MIQNIFCIGKKWNFSGRALSQEKRKDHAKWNEYKKYVTEKRIYIMSIQEQTARSYGRYGCAPDFRSWKALALPFCKRFLRKLSASGRWTNRKTIRQTLSNRFWKSRKVQHLFLHNLPEKKKMNNTWQYSFIKRIPPVMIRLPIEMRMNIPVHERIKI